MEQDSWRSITVRGLTYAGEHAVRLLLTAIVGIIVARYLGPEGLGLLSYAQSVFGLLMPIVLLGLPAILVREFSTGADWRPILASALVIQVPVALLVAVCSFLIVAGSRDFETQATLTAMALIPLPLLTTSQSIRSYLEATGRSKAILVAGISGGLVASAVKIAAVLAGADVWVFAAAATIEIAVVAAGLLLGLPARIRLGSLRRHVRLTVVRDLTRESWPLLLSALAVTIYMRVDVVMLGLIAGDEETGIYAAAARLSEVWYFLPVAAVAALRPTLSRLHARGADSEYSRVLQRFMVGAAAVSYLAVAGVLLLGPRLVFLLYGVEYEPSAVVLQLHILAAPFVFLGVAAGPWFIDRRMSRVVLNRSAAGATINVALNLALIPTMGARGAAIATLVSYALSGVAMNGLSSTSRPIVVKQLRGLLLLGAKLSRRDR